MSGDTFIHLLVCVYVLSLLLCPTLCDPIDYSPREGNGTPLQYSCLANPMDGGAW